MTSSLSTRPNFWRTAASRIMLLTIVAGGIPQLVSAQDWPRFRGPNGTGVSETTGLPVEFGLDKNLTWRRKIPFGRSSPILTKDRVFLTANKVDKQVTLSLDPITVKTVWPHPII